MCYNNNKVSNDESNLQTEKGTISYLSKDLFNLVYHLQSSENKSTTDKYYV